MTAIAAPSMRAEPVAERRLVWVLFVDLAGFTTLSEARDPEEVRQLLSRYFDEARTLIDRYGGTVEKFTGDTSSREVRAAAAAARAKSGGGAWRGAPIDAARAAVRRPRARAAPRQGPGV